MHQDHHIDRAICNRKTEKVLSDSDLTATDCRAIVEELVALAGWAPFHRACEESHRESNGLAGIEPWRFYLLEAEACRRLRRRLPPENAGKVPFMLASADALILATWLPNPPKTQHSEEFGASSALRSANPAANTLQGEPVFEPTMTNMEHIAATAAAIQNLLLAATARGIANYWSSGTPLRTAEMLGLLGIPKSEVLLGAVFLFPAETDGAERVGSKLREHRSPLSRWSRWVEIE